ncbi:ARM repeat-containing protein [Gigaspora margarita]|uniref:ARM repeat-containing protein n=1 Tax=Gigaspora margarita TaxID=4874 RepID=A0A8H4AZL3_GIGMA|nr:ARM repeat-containing protein [Gigaspora margarita]
MNSLETIPRGSDELMQVEIVQRKVKVLLNKLTLEKFDSISDQIIDYANKSKFEKDGCILKEVIRLIFEQFCDEPSFSKMYAQLCRKIMETIDPEIVDKNVTNSEGKFVQGATLFRKYLLNRCQKDFEKNSKESNLVPSIEKGELDLMSDEYFTVAEAKQYRNGLIRFIGEIFKLNMITERIMHECIKKMLNCQNEVFDEEELEGLCKLMMTAGQQLDHIKSKSHMNVYFRRMENISKSSKLSNRIKFMLIDVINLRNNNWVPRCDKSMSSYGSSGQSVSSDDWNRIGGIKSVSQQSGDLAKFGSISHSMVSSRQAGDLAKFGSMSHSKVPSSQFSLTPGGTISVSQTRDFSKFGSVSRSKVPSSQFSLTLGGATFADLTGGSKGWKTTKSEDHKDKNESMSLTNSMSNTYGNLVHFESTETRKLDKLDSSSVGESKKSFPLSSKRKKIVLAPRTAPLTENLSTPKSVLADFSTNSIPAIFKKVTERNINNIVEGYFDIFDMNEVILFIKEQPKEFYSKVIEIFANKALEKKQDDVDKVIMLFNKLTIDNILDKSIFIGGFTATIEFLIDIGIDSPKSYTFTGQLFCAARLDSKDVSDLLKPLSKIDDKGLEKVMAGFKDEFGQLRSVVRRLLSVTNL